MNETDEGTPGEQDGWRSCFIRNLPRQPTTFTLLAAAIPLRHSRPLAILRSNHHMVLEQLPAEEFSDTGCFLTADRLRAGIINAESSNIEEVNGGSFFYRI